jgi:uncharacterized protein
MAPTIVDVDSHVYEPEAIWGDYLPDAVRARARGAFSRRNGTVVLNGEPITLARFNRQAAFRPGLTLDDIGRVDPDNPPPPNPGAWDPAARLADMDTLGIDHAIVLPTLFAEFLPSVADAELAAALARAYNDWVLDFAAAGTGRLHPAAVVALHDPAAAAAEVARVAARGLRAVAVRPVFQGVEGHPPTPAFGGAGDVNPVGIFVDDDAFRPLWQSIAEHGMVACVHPSLGVHNAEGASAGQFLDRVSARMGIGHSVAEPVAYMQDVATFVVAVAFHGLLEDFPALKLALLHGGASIVPLALEKAETYLWLSPQSVFAQAAPVSLEPADVWRAHASLVSFDGWESSAARLPEHFAHKAAWGSRYPHHDASTPADAIGLLERFGATAEVADAMLGGNAAALFGLG